MIWPTSGFMPGEHDVFDALMRQRGGPVFGGQSLLGSRAPRGGILGTLDKALAPFGGMTNVGLSLLSNSGPSPVRRGTGEVLGSSLLQARQGYQGQADENLRREYLRAQIEAMNQPKQRKPLAVMKQDGSGGEYVDEQDAIGRSPYAASSGGDGVGDYQPGDYTPPSWAKFAAGGYKDPSLLERYVTPRQEYSPSFQNVIKTNPDGSTQMGTFDTRSGAYNFTGEIIRPGLKPEVDAAGRARGAVAGAREGKAGPVYNAFQTGMRSLEEAMSNTATNPVAGRLPAVTATQQIAEGAEATMAPLLKQLFRDSGEGTFTDRDQDLLLKMVPTRKDHPEARKAKIEMIDSIVRAKLGIDGAAPAPSSSGNPRRVRVDAQGNVIGN